MNTLCVRSTTPDDAPEPGWTTKTEATKRQTVRQRLAEGHREPWLLREADRLGMELVGA